MKKTLIRTFSLLLTLSLLTGLLCPFASALEYEGVEPITIDSTASLLVNLETDQVLHEENADEIRYPASITKIMTALLTLEAIGRGELTMDTMVTVSPVALMDITDDSSTANIVAGEQISIHDLLYCLMLASANEAANILAMAVAGDIPTFVERMNQRAQELGMENTHFMNPHGLHNSDHYSTAKDIYKMTKEAMTHAPFREIVSTGQYTTAATNLSEARTLYNTNGLLARYKFAGYLYSGTIGVKTGSTAEAGYCLVAAAKKNGITLVSVVLGCENPETNGKIQRKQFSESSRLLDWGFENFTSATLLNPDTYLEEVPVRNSFQATHVVIKPAESVESLIPGEYDPEKLDLRLTLNSNTATAPISKGDVLGKVAVIYGGEQYAKVDMVAVSDVSFSPFNAFISSVDAVLGNLFVRTLLALALLFLLVGVIRRFQAQKRQELKEKRQQRQEEKKQKAEARHIREEAAYAQRKEALDRKRQERDRIREEEQAVRRAEQERRRQEQAVRRAEQERIREERDRVRAEEQAIRRAEQERRRAEQERRRQQEQEARRLEQERRRREQEARRAEQERRRREEARMRQEQERREREERHRREQERRRREAEERRWQEQTRREFYDDRDRRNNDRRDNWSDRRPTARDDRRGSRPPQNKRDHRPNNRR